MSAATKDKARGEGELMFLIALAQDAVKLTSERLGAGAYQLVIDQIDEAISQLKDAREAALKLRHYDANHGIAQVLPMHPLVCVYPLACTCAACELAAAMTMQPRAVR